MEAQSHKVIADMSGENRRQIVLKGGRGGKGNQHYATPTMQVRSMHSRDSLRRSLKCFLN